ncbi:MAG: ABC transporter permease [Halodesulfurarchaeum sp.]
MSRERIEDWLFRTGYWLVAGLVLLPIAVVVVTSFQESQLLQFPPGDYSLEWYRQFATSRRWMSAIVDSFVIGIGASALSTTLGVAGALATRRSDSRLAEILQATVLLPLLIPPVVLGLTFLIYFESIGLTNDVIRVIIAHTIWITPLAYFIMQSVFSRFDWRIREAGVDLGARPRQAFAYVVFPGVKHGIAIAALVTFIVSLQEFIMALYLTGFGTRTVPVLAWNLLNQSLTPMVSVVSTFLVAISILVVFVATTIINLDWLATRI